MQRLMRVPIRGATAADINLGANYTSDIFAVEYLELVNIVIGISGANGAFAGNFKLQASNNALKDNVGDLTNAQLARSDAIWIDIPDSTISVTVADAAVSYNIADFGFEAFRIVFTSSAGTATGKQYVVCKGNGGT